MKKRLLFIPLIVLLLASCNFPLFGSSNTSSEVATRVAQTLIAANSGTPTVQVDGTVVIITATETNLTSASPTVTPTITPTPADPKLTLGSPVFSDTFTSGGHVGLTSPYSDDASEMYIENGNMVMAATKVYSGIRWRLEYPTPRNFYLEGNFKTVICSGKDNYGLVMRAPDYTSGHGYYFGVTCGGEYYFMRDVSGDDAVLVDWTSDSHILTGNGQENRLGVMFKDNHISLYINGNLVKELDDDAIPSAGYFGAFISSREQSNMTIYVEQIDQWNLQ
jgi:hypothetical protein